MEAEHTNRREDHQHGHDKRDQRAEDVVEIKLRDGRGPDRGHERHDSIADKDAGQVKRRLRQEKPNGGSRHVLVLDEILEREDELVVENKGHYCMSGTTMQHNNVKSCA